jgi:hypothetical protein
MKIISASRRTDIPAFYGKWFMHRIHEGFAGYVNPFSGKKYLVSLKKDDVAAIALWSKNFSPFIDNALQLKKEGYLLFFNYTVTGLPRVFEPGCPGESETADSMKTLSSMFSPGHINWRYDPVLISDNTDPGYHADKFRKLCRSLSGYINRCYISFPTLYGKVTKSFRDFTREQSINIHDPDIQERCDLAEKLAVIAGDSGIQVYSCCGDYLTGRGINKGHCIDGDVLSIISGRDFTAFKRRPTRKECGCTESTDIGIYDICPHGCIYCYANSNYGKACGFYEMYRENEEYVTSAFLGVTRTVSDGWVKKIREEQIQPELF